MYALSMHFMATLSFSRRVHTQMSLWNLEWLRFWRRPSTFAKKRTLGRFAWTLPLFTYSTSSRKANATLQCPVSPGSYTVVQTVALPKEIPKGAFVVSLFFFVFTLYQPSSLFQSTDTQQTMTICYASNLRLTLWNDHSHVYGDFVEPSIL